MLIVEYKYNQNQIENRAKYNGLYIYYSVHAGLNGRALALAIAKQFRLERYGTFSKGMMN